LSPTPSGDFFRFPSNGSYYQDMLGIGSGIDSPDEYNLSQFHTSQHTPCVNSMSDTEQGWDNTPPLDQTSELCLDAGHPELEFDGPNSYSIYQGTLRSNQSNHLDNTFEREPMRFQSVAVEATLKYMNGAVSTNSTIASPMDWATQQALMVEDIYSGTTEWMSPPRSINQST
jgi:hypothetical protein